VPREVIAHVTNSERDRFPHNFGRRDTDVRWGQWPEARIVLTGDPSVLAEDEKTWVAYATRDNGDFLRTEGHKSAEKARAKMRKLLERGNWTKAKPKVKPLTALEQLGRIGEPDGELKDFLDKWTDKWGADS
jgi:hypothetical protein